MGEKITVALKLPTALQVGDEYGGFRLNGFNTPNAVVVGGYGITEGVDKDAYEKWAADMTKGPKEQQFAPFARDLIFAADKVDTVRARAAEQTETKSGLEGVDPDKPAPGLEPTDEQKAENAKRGKA